MSSLTTTKKRKSSKECQKLRDDLVRKYIELEGAEDEIPGNWHSIVSSIIWIILRVIRFLPLAANSSIKFTKLRVSGQTDPKAWVAEAISDAKASYWKVLAIDSANTKGTPCLVKGPKKGEKKEPKDIAKELRYVRVHI